MSPMFCIKTMRAQISVTIPTLNAQTALTNMLHCLFEELEQARVFKVIVVDAGSEDIGLKIS